MLTQCIGFVNFSLRLVGQFAHLMVLCDALHALDVEHVAIALDVRVFGQIAQVIVPFDAQLALLVDHVAIALDERVFAQIAQVIVPFDTQLAHTYYRSFDAACNRTKA